MFLVKQILFASDFMNVFHRRLACSGIIIIFSWVIKRFTDCVSCCPSPVKQVEAAIMISQNLRKYRLFLASYSLKPLRCSLRQFASLAWERWEIGAANSSVDTCHLLSVFHLRTPLDAKPQDVTCYLSISGNRLYCFCFLSRAIKVCFPQ